MQSSKEHILKRLATEVDSTIDAFRALEPPDWALTVYTDGAAWTPREILAHQVTTERAIHMLVASVLAGGEGAPEGFDIQRFNEGQARRLADRSVEDLYADFRDERAAVMATVGRMTDEDFARLGRHPWLGQAPLEEVLKLLYRHNMLHVRDVQRAVRARQAAADRKRQLREHLAATRARLLDLAARLRPEDWERPVQGEGARWTARQALAHLASAETGQLALLKGIADGGPGAREDFDLNRWNARQVERSAGRSPDDLLAALHASRLELLAALDAITGEQLDRAGRHGRGDTLTVEQIFYRIGAHEVEHVTLMEAALGPSA